MPPESRNLFSMSNVVLICGVDEAGRGPWAGPVCAGAVILDPERPIAGLNDSKALSEKRRISLADTIKAYAAGWALGWASAEEIDVLNIRQATHLAMRRAVDGLVCHFDRTLVDGNDCPAGLPAPAEARIKGDRDVAEISAASILAKTARDALMCELDVQYPGYEFAQHKGYGTKAHSNALARLGPCEIHRQSFAPVRTAAKQFKAA